MKIFKIIICLFILFVFVGCGSEYEVKFLGFDDVEIKTEIVKAKDEITYPEVPNVEGYEFTGWDKEIINVSENTIIKAQYKKLVYIVNFYNKNKELIDTQNVEYGESAIIPTEGLDIVGYDLTGWDKDYTNVKSNLDLYPIYEVSKYNVKFYGINGELITEKEVLYGETVIVTAPEVEGHTFVSWDCDFSNVVSDMEVKALYEIDKYKVTFLTKNNKVHETVEVEYGSKIEGIFPPELEGYTFIEWDQDLSFIKNSFIAKPIYEKNKYVVTFYDENGNKLSEQVVEHGKDAKAPEAPEKDGYFFSDWDQDYTNVKGDLDLNPIYEEITYVVQFVNMYGDLIESQRIKPNGSAVAPTPPTVDYYTFSKWDQDYTNVTKDITVKAIYTKTNQSFDIKDVNYWLQVLSKEYDIKKIILNEEEIKLFNKSVTSSYGSTKVLDITNVSKVSTKSYVEGLINRYSNINKYNVYDNNSKTVISSTTKNQILENRNLTNIQSSVEVKFGLVVDFGWLRSYPTNHYSNNYSMDRFQETTLNVGEGVAIYHESLDKEWVFVQAMNYNGWIEKKYIAECSFEEMVNFLNPEERLVVISDYVELENAHVRMGQSFPLLENDQSKYKISFPSRTNEGKLVLKELSFGKTNDYNVGYLDYTYENVFKQAFKLLGIDYSWGDKEKDGRDCSSTMNAIYNSFGFMMPRNTSNQVAIPTYGKTVSGLTVASLMTYKPGTMIFTSSHVMLYIGENEQGVPYLLHNTNAGNGECILQTFESYGGSKMIGVLRMQ